MPATVILNVDETKRYSGQTGQIEVYDIVGETIPEIIAECMTRIRPQSKEFYGREIAIDLAVKGFSTINQHAGKNTVYNIYLLSFLRNKFFK